MLRNRSDQFGKNVLRELLSLGGDARTEEEVPPADAQRIDVWFVPDAARLGALRSMKGTVAAIAEAPAVIELWSDALSVRGFHGGMRKLYDWHHTLELRDKRVWELPALWHLCAGLPEAVFAEFLLEPVPDGHGGSYRLLDQGFPGVRRGHLRASADTRNPAASLAWSVGGSPRRDGRAERARSRRGRTSGGG